MLFNLATLVFAYLNGQPLDLYASNPPKRGLVRETSQAISFNLATLVFAYLRRQTFYDIRPITILPSI